MTRNEMKTKAVECMEQLKINPLFAMRFSSMDKIAYFDKRTPLFGEVPQIILDKVKEIENEKNCLIYAVTSDEMAFGKCYSFLMISPYKEDWLYLIQSAGLQHRVYAYVWNTTDEWRSESGYVVLLSENGRLNRIG